MASTSKQLNSSNDPLQDNRFLSKAKVICDEMIYYCFDVLHSVLHTTRDPPKPSFPNNQYPLFVTWYIGRELNLRGCIGTFSPMALHDGLNEYAKISAFQDSRFNPISKVNTRENRDYSKLKYWNICRSSSRFFSHFRRLLEILLSFKKILL